MDGAGTKPVFGVDEKLKQRLLEKAKRRIELREELLKLKFDPFRHASQEGGGVFDAAMMRHQAMKQSYVEHFKPSPKTIMRGLGYLVIPTFLLTYTVLKLKDEEERKYRSGEVAYRDRRFKFV